ncbi:hypothetical protein CRV24_009784 [Beauveria bassiana]|nr:hypothetical protein CRV24_009784 [Beauveria bassiana]
MDNVFFPSMAISDVAPSDNAGTDPPLKYTGVDGQLPSDSLFSDPFASNTTDWDSYIRDFGGDDAFQDTGSFNTSLLSTSPVASASLRNTPDTVISNVCMNTTGAGEGFDERNMAAEHNINTTNMPEPSSHQQPTTFTTITDLAANDYNQTTSNSASYPATTTGQATGMAAGTVVCSAATLGAPQTEPALVMNASPRRRVSRLPPDIGADGQIKYLEPHEIPQTPVEGRQYSVQHGAQNNLALPPELEKHLYHLPGQEYTQQQQQVPQRMPAQPMQSQPMQSQPMQSQPMSFQQIQQMPGPPTLQSSQRPQHFQQSQHASELQNYSNQRFYVQNPDFIQNAQHAQHPQQQSQHPQHPQHPQYFQNHQNPQYLQHGNFPSRQQHSMDPRRIPQQTMGQDPRQFSNMNSFQPGMHAPRPATQQSQQSMAPAHGRLQIQTHPLTPGQVQMKTLPMIPGQLQTQTHPMTPGHSREAYYTAEGYRSSSTRAEKPPTTNGNEFLRGRDFRPVWSVGEINTNWLDTSLNTVEPHVKPFLKKDIKLGMSSQNATKAAITDGFVRGAAWAAKLFLTQIDKEMRGSGTMLGFRPHKKVQKTELEKSVVEHIVRNNPPSIHGAQCANVIAWAYDEFYPGVFRQEGSNGQLRGPKEILEAWKTLRDNVEPNHLKPVLYDTSTGLTVMTDLQPSRPPVAQVRTVMTQGGQVPAIKFSQFSAPDATNGHIAVNSGENFFTNPQVPASMALQQTRRAEPATSKTIAKPPGAKTTPKTAEEKKENRNRKVDSRLQWTLTGQSRPVKLEKLEGVSYYCSDGQFRILEGERLQQAMERTQEHQRRQSEARAMAGDAGTSMHSTANDKSTLAVATGVQPSSSGPKTTSADDDQVPQAMYESSLCDEMTDVESQNDEATATYSVDDFQTLQAISRLDSNTRHQATNRGEVRRKRVPDEESMPAGRRKRGRQDVQQGLEEQRTGNEMLHTPHMISYADD